MTNKYFFPEEETGNESRMSFVIFQMDILGPFPVSFSGNKYLSVISDGKPDV